MDDAALQRVCSLAASLRKAAHLLLDRRHKLSLDTWTLIQVQEAFSLILEVEQHTNFHVLPPNHRQHPAIPHLQFVYDLLQKIFGLRLWAKDEFSLPQNETISLRCFRNVQALELVHIPVNRLKALQSLRPSLRSVVVVRGLSKLSDLFIKCGADKAGEFVWEQLQEVVLSHNALYTLDKSLCLLPNLKVLDLSNCSLTDASALEYLPSVCFLDVSHNQLSLLPRLSSSASYLLTTLIANNNLLSHLSGLHEMNNIEELDLRDNVLSIKDVLSPLGSLPHLRVLKISGNPIAWDVNYRSYTIKQLNPATANHEVIFDGQLLTSIECEGLGLNAKPTGSAYPPELLSSLSSLCSPVPTSPDPGPPSLCSPQDSDLHYSMSTSQAASMFLPESSTTSASKASGNGQPRKRSKRSRIRNIAIADPVDSDVDDSEPHEPEGEQGDNAAPSLSASLQDRIPDAPPPSLAVGPTYLSSTQDTLIQAFTSLTHKTSERNVTAEQNDKLLEEILQSKSEVQAGSKDSSIEQADQSSDKSSGKTSEDGDSTVGAATQPDTADTSHHQQSLDSSFYKDSANVSRRSSADVSPPQSDSEEDSSGIHLVLVQREVRPSTPADRDGGVHEAEGPHLYDVILCITNTQFKEKHPITMRTIFRWDVRTLESIEILSTSPHKILLTFDTIRPAYKTRTYVLDEEDYETFMNVLNPVLERRTLEEMLHSAMMCLKCNTQFSRDLAQQPDDTLRCPNCGGGVVVRAESVDHPAMALPPTCDPLKVPFCSTPNTSGCAPHVAPAVPHPGTDTGSCLGESSESVSVCSEASSCVRRDSDVEVISNPSVSSIEVINDQHVIHDVIVEEEGDGERGPLPASLNTDARTPASSPVIHKQEAATTAMQESSSSGSMTGSVCTTYEKTGSLPTSPQKATTKLHPSHSDIVDGSSHGEHSVSDVSSSLYLTADSSLAASLTKASPPPSLSNSPNFSSSCTSIDTVKNGNLSTGLHHKAVMTSIQDNQQEKSSEAANTLSSWAQTILHSLTGYYWVWWKEAPDAEGIDKIANPICYSYEDFSDVDHRLKLHCEVLLFHEPDETLLGLVKAVLLVKGGRREFQGLLVVSNKKLYLLEVVAAEDDSPQTWLELVSSHKLSEVHTIYSLYHRQGLAYGVDDTIILLSFADSLRANGFFNFLSESLDNLGINPKVEECSLAQECALVQLVQEAVNTQHQAPPLLFAIISLLIDGGCSESQFLVITESDLVLFHADLPWYLPPAPAPGSTLALNLTQKIYNITAIEVLSASHLVLQFMDEVTGEESCWQLHVTSPVAACHIIQTIKAPWMQLFSVDLQVTYHKPHQPGALPLP